MLFHAKAEAVSSAKAMRQRELYAILPLNIGDARERKDL